MKLALNVIAHPSFQEAFVELLKQPLPAVPAYRLAQIAKVFQEKLTAFETARLSSVEAHCSTPGDRNTLDTDAFRVDVEKLLDEEVEVFLPERVVLTDKVVMTANQLSYLDAFIDPKTDPQAPSNIVPLPKPTA